MTAVDWLVGELIHKGLMALRYDKDNTFNELIGQAKQMEAQEKIDILMDIDLDLAMIEDYAHDDIGNDITKLRIKIDELLKLK
jgi:hypothetical protein